LQVPLSSASLCVKVQVGSLWLPETALVTVHVPVTDADCAWSAKQVAAANGRIDVLANGDAANVTGIGPRVGWRLVRTVTTARLGRLRLPLNSRPEAKATEEQPVQFQPS
jgi:hypothetical protein